MAMRDAEDFAGKEIAMVYIAGRLAEAQRVEHTLSQHQIDYIVDFEPFEVKVLGILPTSYTGVAFYVLSGQAEFCRALLREADLLAGLVEEDPL